VPRRAEPAAAAPAAPGAAAYALAYAAYVGALLVVYEPALDGPFLSDDIHYVATNPYVHELGLESLWTILQPWGAATVSVVNYAPLQLLMHSVAWRLFGPEVTGHHVLNLLFHAAGSLLLFPLLLSSGVARAGAALASVFFLLHPANVEAVAWISQLKTNSALALCLLAVLLHPRRPGFALALFTLALLAKPNAAAALPLAFWLEWVRRGRVRTGWLAAWLVVFSAFAVVETTAHQRSGAAEATLHATPAALLRTIAGLAIRYLVMGGTSWGVSTFHEPDPAQSWLDPWWLASLPALSLLGWRLASGLRARREEAGYWLAALVSFGPVSQIFPFLYPFADRYLYFILPGLLGGALLAGSDLLARLPPARRAPAARAAAALALAACFVFAVRSHERARIWSSPALVQADAAANYPDGVAASLQRAKRAAQSNDADLAAAEVRRAIARGYNRFEQLLGDPAWEPIRGTPPFQAVVRETAQMWIDASAEWEDPTQIELHRIASAHVVRGEREQALALLRRALARGGPLDEQIRAELLALGARP
jgi:hypothetical protein